jgi:hypothetical protein
LASPSRREGRGGNLTPAGGAGIAAGRGAAAAKPGSLTSAGRSDHDYPVDEDRSCMPEQLSIVVPSRDGAPYAFVLADEYRRHGLRPLYLIDSRSTRRYRAQALARIDSAAILEVEEGPDFVEAILPEIAGMVDTKWLFRLDDDEFPSARLIPWLTQTVATTSKTVIAVPRRAVAIRDGTPMFAGTMPQLHPGDRQYRGFVVATAKFNPLLHSPGILGESADVHHAPDDCCIYHFDWIVRSKEQRARKLKHYEAIAGGALPIYRHQYLYEDFDPALFNFTAVDEPSIADLALRLLDARLQHASPQRRPRRKRPAE